MTALETAPSPTPLPLRIGRTPVALGILLALIGFGIGVAIVAIVRTIIGFDAWDTNQSWTSGYIVALMGWLAGVGGWRYWGREFVGLEVDTYETKGWARYFGFSPDHKVIGIQYIVTFIVLFLIGGLVAMLLRGELTQTGTQILSGNDYNATMSFHGISMVAVAVALLIGGLGNYVVPIMIGARDMAFPRLNALSYWLVPPVAVMLLISLLALGGWNSGWTAYPPLSVINGSGQTLFNLAIITFGFVSILGGINFLATIIFERAPGMSFGRLPIFVWSIFAASLLSFFFTQAFAASMLMIHLDRLANTSFFNAEAGTNAILYEHVFWFYSHPAVYIMVIPGFGAALEVLTHFSRKPLYGYRWVVGGLLSITGIAGVVWAHHMFTSGMSASLQAPFLVVTEIISIPTGLIFFGAIGTIWAGKLWLKVPMLFALAFIFNFLIGGLTGVFLADVPTDLHLHDTYFIVAHFHYTIMGGEIFALFAGIYFWYPKITGRRFNERLAKIHFWLMFIGFQLTFLPMFWLGQQGMNRRIADYPADLEGVNIFVSASAFLLGASFLFFAYNMVYSWFRGPAAGDNPWHASTLEWTTTSPPPEENFEEIPTVVGHPYPYGTHGAKHAEIPAQVSAAPAGGGGGGGGD